MAIRRLPPLRALEAFMRTVRLGSARSAAAELGLSPSALSRRIGNLEDFTGKKMFSRSGQTMKLTDEGRAFYDAVQPHLDALATAVENQSEKLQLLRLRLGVLPLFGSQRLFPKLPDAIGGAGEECRGADRVGGDLFDAPGREQRVDRLPLGGGQRCRAHGAEPMIGTTAFVLTLRRKAESSAYSAAVRIVGFTGRPTCASTSAQTS